MTGLPTKYSLCIYTSLDLDRLHESGMGTSEIALYTMEQTIKLTETMRKQVERDKRYIRKLYYENYTPDGLPTRYCVSAEAI